MNVSGEPTMGKPLNMTLQPGNGTGTAVTVKVSYASIWSSGTVNLSDGTVTGNTVGNGQNGPVFVFAPAGGDTEASCAAILHCRFIGE